MKKKKRIVQKESLENKVCVYNEIVSEKKEDHSNVIRNLHIFSIISLISIISSIVIRLLIPDQSMINCLLAFIVFYYMHFHMLNKSKRDAVVVLLNAGAIYPTYKFLLEHNPLDMIELSSNYQITNILYFYTSFVAVTISLNSYKKIIYAANTFFDILKITETVNGLFKVILLYFTTIPTIIIICIFYIKYMENKNQNLSDVTTLFNIMFFSIYIIPLTITIYSIFRNLVKKDYKIRDRVINLIQRYENKINSLEYSIYKHFNYDMMKNTEFFSGVKLHIINIIMTMFIRYGILLSLFVAHYSMTNYYFFYTITNDEYCINIEKNASIVKLENGNVLKLIKKDNGPLYFTEYECKKKMRNIKVNR